MERYDGALLADEQAAADDSADGLLAAEPAHDGSSGTGTSSGDADGDPHITALLAQNAAAFHQLLAMQVPCTAKFSRVPNHFF